MENENETIQIDESRKVIPFEQYEREIIGNSDSENESYKDFLISFALELGLFDDSDSSQKEIYLSEVGENEIKEHSETQEYDTAQQDKDDLNELYEEKKSINFEFAYCDMANMNGKGNGDIDKRIKEIQEQNRNRENAKILKAIKRTIRG